MKVPQIVKEVARTYGFNNAKYCGELDGAKVYGVETVDSNGLPVPTGLPTFLLLKDGDITIVSGNEGLDLDCKLP